MPDQLATNDWTVSRLGEYFFVHMASQHPDDAVAIFRDSAEAWRTARSIRIAVDEILQDYPRKADGKA